MSRRGAALLLLPALAACASAPASRDAAAGPTPASSSRAGARYGEEPDVRPTAVEAELLAAARSRVGRRIAHSPALSLAARELAARWAGDEPGARSRSALREALARAGAFDDAPSSFTARSDAPGRVAAALSAALSRCGDCTHAGAGVFERGGTTVAVILTSARKARIERFPSQVAPGARVTLRGRLVGLAEPRVFVTDPSGTARELGVKGTSPFAAQVAFDAPGQWRVEVVGDGPTGPQVAALMVVGAGAPPAAEPDRGPREADPASPAEAEAQVLGAVNALRGRRGLPRLEASDALRDQARRQSEAMLAAGLLAHVLPGSGDVGARLRRAGIPYRSVFENLARASGALEAHQSLEESPAHLANLLAPAARRIGVGIARGTLPSGGAVVYLTEILMEPVDDSSESRLRPEERVRQALWRERERLSRPPLLADPALDELAARAARAMLRAGAPGVPGLPGEALALGRRTAAADAFVAASPVDASRSRNLADAQFRRVGVGVAVGDSPRYGAGLLWIAVLYTD